VLYNRAVPYSKTSFIFDEEISWRACLAYFAIPGSVATGKSVVPHAAKARSTTALYLYPTLLE